MILPDQNFLDNFKKTNGALSVTESIAIMNLTSQAPQGGVWCELGVYMGKSSMSALYGGKCDEFHLVEPEFEKTISTQEVASTIASVTKEKSRLAFIVGYSTDYLRDTGYKYNYVFVDSGSHQDGLPMQEVKLLEDKMNQGGIIAFHDWNSQFKEVKGASDYLVSTGKYEYVKIEWELIVNHVLADNLEDGNMSWHHTELKCPQFVGAVIRK